MKGSAESCIVTWVVSSQTRIFSSAQPIKDLSRLTALRNEPISFCMAYRSNYQKRDDEKIPDLPISVSVECSGIDAALYKIGYVPFLASDCEDGNDEPGLCPDVLLRKQSKPKINPGDDHLPFYEVGEQHLLNVSCIETGGVWITLNEDRKEIPAGDHKITVQVTSLTTNEPIAEHTLTLHVVDESLPDAGLFYTNWFHYDCIADLHGLELYSDAFFEVLAKYIKNAVKNGMTTLLTPAFTPALDTPTGFERRNVQLVGVKRENGCYTFDFSLLERFVKLALDCGITNIEHCHLFSQWGALSAINIYAEENGQTTRIFSWDDSATGAEYAAFLQAYLPAFLDFAERMGISDHLLFHISDEPKDFQANDYSRALSVVKEYLAGHTVGDALSHYALYEKGLVETPVVATDYANDFYGNCDNMMLYYTGGRPNALLSNRTLTSSPQKTRILGVQLYKYRAKGFLHWGYNYYYGRMCHGVFNPMQDPLGYRNMPAVSYLVYPTFDRDVAPSIREMQMRDAMSDYSALKLLERLIGRAETERFCEDFFGEAVSVFLLPKSGAEMCAFRDALNAEIERHLK